MNTIRNLLLVAVAALPLGAAQAQTSGSLFPETPKQPLPGKYPTKNTSSSTQETGTIIKKQIRWDSRIPLDKTYAELTPEQKAELHAMYENLPEGDEPPFPATGIRPIFNAIRKAQRIRQAQGELNMAVTVGPDGNAIKVEDRGGVYDIQMTEIAQQVLLLTKYKPAVCKGQPCTMQFRFTQKLKAG